MSQEKIPEKNKDTEISGSFDVTGSDRAIAEALKGIEKLETSKHPEASHANDEGVTVETETTAKSDNRKNEEWREQLVSLLKQKDATIKDAHDRFLRQAADFENYKKRLKKDQEIENERTVERVLRELLPIIDSFERTLRHSATVEQPSADFATLMDGIRLVQKQVFSFLEKFHVLPIDSKGKAFDPALHEAVSQYPTMDFPHMHVAEELERGFTLGKRLLRAAKVVVAIKPPEN